MRDEFEDEEIRTPAEYAAIRRDFARQNEAIEGLARVRADDAFDLVVHETTTLEGVDIEAARAFAFVLAGRRERIIEAMKPIVLTDDDKLALRGRYFWIGASVGVRLRPKKEIAPPSILEFTEGEVTRVRDGGLMVKLDSGRELEVETDSLDVRLANGDATWWDVVEAHRGR